MSSFFCKWFQVAFVRSLGIADAISSVVGIAGAAYVHYKPGAGTVVSELIWQIPLGAFAVTVFVRLVMAPYWIWKEQEETIIQLRSQLGERQSRQAVRDALTQPYRVGQELMHRDIQNNEDYRQLEEEFENWKTNMIEVVRQMVSEPDAARLHIVRASMDNWEDSHNKEHNEVKNFISTRLDILEGIIDRYQETSS